MSEVKRYTACIDGIPVSRQVVLAEEFDAIKQRLIVADKRVVELEGLLQMFVDNSDDKDVVELSENALKAGDDFAPIDDQWEK